MGIIMKELKSELKIYKEYKDCYLYELDLYVKQGYEPLEIFYEDQSETQSVSGSFMGNSVSLNIPFIRSRAKMLIGRTNAAKLLYDESLKIEKPS